VLDAVLRDDPDAHVACETATTTGMIIVFGEISTSTYVEIPTVVRDVVREIGYTHSKYGFDAKTCGVMVSIQEQSLEISSGVEQALEVREGHKVDRYDQIGAGDQGMNDRLRLSGDAGADAAADLVGRTRSAVAWRRPGTRRRSPTVRPDGKSQVTVEYRRGAPVRGRYGRGLDAARRRGEQRPDRAGRGGLDRPPSGAAGPAGRRDAVLGQPERAGS
jgi:S-adenosylmethionine synthetase